MKSLIQKIPIVLMTVFIFYYTYPQALDIGGSSFVFVSGIFGFALYIYHKLPFREVLYVIIALLAMFFVFYTSSWVNNYTDPFTFGYMRSQIAWFFSAYLVIFFLFKIHKVPSFHTLLIYAASAILIQSVVAFAMYLNEGVHDFFTSLQMQIQYTEELIEAAEKERLVGYGIALFGAGAMSGFGLIVMAYLLMKLTLNKKQFALLAVVFVFCFYIGLFMARTTITGMIVALGLIGVLYFKDNKAQRKQGNTFLITMVFLLIAGYSLVFIYFPSFTDWAFELFNNFVNRGKLETRSSSGLSTMFMIPQDIHTLIFGNGHMEFWGSDVGYTRLMFYAGVPGMLIYFIYQMVVIKLGFTKDWSVNILTIAMFIYCLGLNVKGLIDLNFFSYLVFFYFMFYKYYVFMPNVRRKELILERQKRLNT